MLYPPLAGLFGFVPRVWQRREQAAKRDPCDARQARRAGAAWTPAVARANGLGRAPLPIRTSGRIRMRPSWIETAPNIRALERVWIENS